MRPFYILLLLLLTSCGYNRFDTPEPVVRNKWEPNTNIEQLKEIANTGSITQELVVEAVVTSSDSCKNFYKQLIIQDHTGALNLQISLYDLYIPYPRGSVILLNLQGLALSYKDDVLTCGFANTSPATVSPITTPYLLSQHLCNTYQKRKLDDYLSPVRVIDISTSLYCRLVAIRGVFEKAGESTFAGEISFKDYFNSSITIYTSAYASFANQKLPYGDFLLIGIVTIYKGKPQIMISSPEDFKWI